MVDLVPDFGAAADFLGSLFPGGPWTVVAIEPEPPPGEKPRAPGATFDDRGALLAWLERHARWNLYYAVNRAPGAATTPYKSDLTELVALHVDLDLPKGERPSEGAFASLLGRLRAVRPEPTATVFSGGGYQALWVLDAPLPADDAAVARVEEANRAIASSLGADHCWNANRLMRLPGTVNRLSATKVARGRVPALAFVVSSSDAAFRLGVDPVPRAVEEEDGDPGPSRPEEGAPTVEPLGDDEPSIVDLPARLRRTVEKGDASAWGGDRSRMVFYAVCSLVRRGWSDAAIVAVLLDARYAAFNVHVREQGNPRRYAARQVASARAKLAADWRRTATGAIDRGSRENVLRALSEVGARFSRDEFSGRDYVNGASGPLRRVDDDAMVEIRFAVDASCGFLPDRDLLADAARFLSTRARFHPVLRRLDSLAWDGVERLETWLVRAADADDTPYVRAVSKLTLIGGIRRVREPGSKFDQMIVFVDPKQGTGKSSAVQILAMDLDWFTDSLPLGASPKQVIERLAGKWIVESSDLSGMNKRDVTELKDFLSRRSDLDRLSYDHYPTEVPRHSIFFGTTNSEVFLKDDQNRRFWPVRVHRFDLAWLRENVVQLWAEADARYRAGESDELPEELWGVAAERQADVRAHEPWVEILDDAFGDIEGRVVNRDVFKIIDKPDQHQLPDDDKRIATAMREIGFVRKRAKFFQRTKIVYERWSGARPGQPTPIFVHRDPLTKSLTVSHSVDPEAAFGLDGDPIDRPSTGFHPGEDPPF